MKLTNKQWAAVPVVAVILIVGYFFIFMQVTNNIKQGEAREERARQGAIQRQACYNKYQKLFKNATDIDDPLNYKTTNPELYNCLNKLKAPLEVIDIEAEAVYF